LSRHQSLIKTTHMKTSNLLKILFISTAFLTAGGALSYTGVSIKGKDASACLEVTGKITGVSTKDNFFTVYLFCYNTIVDSVKVTQGKTFRFRLVKNQQYSIKMEGSGFVSRLLSISTHLPEEVSISPVFRFHFETELIEQNNAKALNNYALDFPIALISFDPQKSIFDYNRKYTARIKKEITLQSTKQ
jgi:hypothetical protein